MRSNKIMAALLLWLVGSMHTAMAEVESWYLNASLGIVGHTYEEPLNSAVEAADALPGVDRTQLAFDLGVYFPMGEQTVVGGVLGSSSDTLDDGWDHITISQSLTAASVMHFFGSEPGHGFFLRGDYGIARLTVSSSFYPDVTSDSGTGLLLGVGYGIKISEDSRLLLSLTTTNNSIEGAEYRATGFRVSGMW